MAVSMQSRVVRNPDPIAEPVDDELVMADIDAGKYYGFNEIGAAIWVGLEKAVTVADLCARLCETYDVSPEECSRQVLAFLGELEKRKLVFAEG